MDRGTLTLRHHVARVRSVMADGGWALLPLRLLVGYGFAAHGYAKLARGPAAFAESSPRSAYRARCRRRGSRHFSSSSAESRSCLAPRSCPSPCRS